jgi:hypothetical protein
MAWPVDGHCKVGFAEHCARSPDDILAAPNSMSSAVADVLVDTSIIGRGYDPRDYRERQSAEYVRSQSRGQSQRRVLDKFFSAATKLNGVLDN